MEDNTFYYVLGDEKETAVEVQCVLFEGEYTKLIGSLPWKDRQIGASMIFFFFFLPLLWSSMYRMKKKLTKNNLRSDLQIIFC